LTMRQEQEGKGLPLNLPSQAPLRSPVGCVATIGFACRMTGGAAFHGFGDQGRFCTPASLCVCRSQCFIETVPCCMLLTACIEMSKCNSCHSFTSSRTRFFQVAVSLLHTILCHSYAQKLVSRVKLYDPAPDNDLLEEKSLYAGKFPLRVESLDGSVV